LKRKIKERFLLNRMKRTRNRRELSPPRVSPFTKRFLLLKRATQSAK